MGTVFIFAIVVLLKIDTAFSGYCTLLQTTYARTYKDCGLWGWSRCTTYRPYTVLTQVCCPGWRGTSCSVPICNNQCVNGGRCIGPNKCKCPASSLGQQCSTDVCSHIAPCYPGTCSFPHTCSCYNGFTDSTNGCLSFSRGNNPPVISECEFTLAHIRRTDQKQQFYFSVPCSDGYNKSIIWCNQQLFNNAKFTMKSMYPKLPSLPPPPEYIQGLGFGIVYNGINVKQTKSPRAGDNTGRHVAFDRNYNCSGLSNTAPRDTLSSCEIQDNYRVYIEHNDFITVTYSNWWL